MHENEVKEMLDSFYSSENNAEEAQKMLLSMLKDDFNELFVKFISLGRELSKMMFNYGGDIIEYSEQYSLMLNLLKYTNPSAYGYWTSVGTTEIPEENEEVK